MAHLVINKKEIQFLRESILKRYCDSSNQNYDNFCKNLTGTIKYYENICEYIQENINNYSKILNYTNLISDTTHQALFKKQLEGTEIEKRRFLRELANNISANVLRKLIFNGPDEKSQKYKDSFILVCYIYLEIDRNSFLKNYTDQVFPDTVNILSLLTNDNSDNTITSFLKIPSSCSLKPLLNNTEEIDNSKPILIFEGNKIELNRNNIDKENNTITSKVQAELIFEDGEWTIVNKSQLKTTFLQVINSTKINKGDIIVLGNRRFLFDD